MTTLVWDGRVTNRGSCILTVHLFFQPIQSSHCSQKWKGRGAYLQKCHVMISRSCIVGKVIELTGLVGRRTAKGVCNATFAI